MSKGRLSEILLTLIVLALGGVTMATAQDKPPLLGTPSDPEYGRTPPPPQPRAALPVPGQIPSPSPSPGMAPPPPPPPDQGMVPSPPRHPTGARQEILDNALKAVTTARKAKTYFTVGKVWSVTAPRGEMELKAAVLYDKAVVAVLHFNPTDGSLLPLGVDPAVYGSNSSMDEIKQNLPNIVRKLEVLQGAEYREPENSWVVPLAYQGMIVAHIKVYANGAYIVPDYLVNQEMQAYMR